MKHWIGQIAVLPGLAVLAFSGTAQAQATALAEANARGVCGGGVAVSAVYVPGGLLQVSCRAPSTQSTQAASTAATQGIPAPLAGAGLSAGAIAGVAGGVLLLVVVASGGDGGSSTTTTTTTTTTTSTNLNQF
ncbi:MAG: hypothetical protein ACWA5A_06665 [Marinibacterium sp.]